MSTAADMLQIFGSLDIGQIARDVMTRSGGEYIDANREQMMDGLRNDGNTIGSPPGRPYMSLKYAKEKNEMNSRPGIGNPDLKLTGAFHASMQMDVQNDVILVTATDPKAEDLEKKYGSRIYGLGGDRLGTFIKEVYAPAFYEEITQATGLTFV